MPRGNFRGRGRGNYSLQGAERASALDRLGKVVYPKGVNDKNAKRFKYVRPTTVSPTCSIILTTLPTEIKELRTLVERFLKIYYDIFDRPGRANLETLYSADAFFSFSATQPLPTVGRNLLEVREPGQRLSMLFYDKTNIAKALATFSPTEHRVSCLTVDVPYYMANPLSVTSLQLVVAGVFKDTSQTSDSFRAFTRVFVLKQKTVDKDNRPIYEIFNDLFMIQQPTSDQVRKHNIHLIKSIMTKTKMNEEGSIKLLEESQWNEEKAMAVFNQLFPENKIPPGYFS